MNPNFKGEDSFKLNNPSPAKKSNPTRRERRAKHRKSKNQKQ